MKKLLLLLYLLGSYITGIAQISFYVQPIKEAVYESQPFNIEFVVEGSVSIKKFIQPAHKDLIYLSGPFEQSENLSINGKKKKVFTTAFIVVSHIPGKIILPPAEIVIGDKVYKTEQLLINILPRADAHKSSSDLPLEKWPEDENKIKEIINKNLFVKLECDKTSCYVGQPITVSYKLYTRFKSQLEILKQPSFNGFSATDIPTEDVEMETKDTVDGKIYTVYTLRKSQLIPLHTGKLSIDKIKVENRVFLLTRKDHEILKAYNGFLPYEVPITSLDITSSDFNIDVKPLPETSENFSGMVGNYKINAHLQSNNFPLNKSGELIIDIIGDGNLKMITTPDVPWPNGIEVFDSIVKDDLNFKDPQLGKRSFHFLFATDTTGNFTIPEIAFNIFNIQTEQYETIKTQPINFTVSESVPTKLTSEKKKPIYPIIIITTLLIISISAILFFLKSKRKKPIPPQVHTNELLIEKMDPFQQSKKLLFENDHALFYKTLSAELKAHVANSLHIDIQKAQNNLLNEMDARNASCEVCREVEALLNELDESMYAPLKISSNHHQLLARAESIDINSSHRPV